MRKPGQSILIVGFVLLIAVCGLMVIKAKKGPRWYGSPTDLRTNSSYASAMRPEPPLPHTMPLITNMVVQTSNIPNKIVIQYVADPSTRRINFAVEKELMLPGKTLQLGGANLRLHSTRVAYGPLTWQRVNEWSEDVDWRVFEPDGNELSPDQIKNWLKSKWDRQGNYRGTFPQVRWDFEVSGGSVPKLLDSWVFDARTQKSLSSGRSSSFTTNSIWFETELKAWHQTPLDVVFDVAYERGEPVTIPMKEGASYSSTTVTLSLAKVFPGSSRSWGSSSDGRTNTFNLSFSQNTNETVTSILFIASPSSSPLPLDIEFIGKGGTKLNRRGGGSSDRFLVDGFHGEPEDCEQIQITPYLKVKRIILKMPELPGLPESNRDIENLFSVQMPYVRVTSEWQLRELIESSVQMNMRHTSVTIPPGRFPMILTNTTPAELLDVYNTLVATNLVLNVNPKTFEMAWVENNPIARFRAFFKQVFRSN